MKKVFFISFIIFRCFVLSAQQSNKFSSLDRFFAGIPLQSSFEKWFQYVVSHPYLGIDSTNRRGNHSTLKPGIDSYFPFPDSLNVKIVFQMIIYADAGTQQFIDSLKTIYIEGFFGPGKPAKKESNKFFRGLRRELMRYYRYEYRDYYEPASWFYRGKTNQFPYCSLHLGYSSQLKSYYVRLAYNDDKQQIIKKYLPPDNTLRF